MTFAVFAASLAAKVTGTICAAAGAGSALTAFGRTAMTGVPLRDPGVHGDRAAEVRLLDCRRRAAPAVTLTASVSTPEFVLTASRPAISLPSVVPATSTAAGDLAATSCASSSAAGATA